jgi:hypothetical protein
VVRLKLQVIWGTTPVDVKKILVAKPETESKKPKLTSEKQENTGKNP